MSPHRLSAERTVNLYVLLLLLLLRFASVFPVTARPLLFSSTALGRTCLCPDGSAGLVLSAEASDVDGAAWKNLWRATCVFCADDVQDWGGGVRPGGFGATVGAAGGTAVGRGAGWVWTTPLDCRTEPVSRFSAAALEGEVLQLFLQTKVSALLPGL